jgi:hypothetical protein
VTKTETTEAQYFEREAAYQPDDSPTNRCHGQALDNANDTVAEYLSPEWLTVYADTFEFLMNDCTAL